MKMIECNYMCRCRYHDNKMEESVLFCYLRIYPFLWNQNVPFFNLMSYSVILLLYAKTHILFCFVQTILLNGTYISYASLFNHRTYIKGITAIKYEWTKIHCNRNLNVSWICASLTGGELSNIMRVFFDRLWKPLGLVKHC